MKTVDKIVVLLLVLLISTNNFPPFLSADTVEDGVEIIISEDVESNKNPQTLTDSRPSGSSRLESSNNNIGANKVAKITDKRVINYAENIANADKRDVFSASQRVAGVSNDINVDSKEEVETFAEIFADATEEVEGVVVTAFENVADATKEVEGVVVTASEDIAIVIKKVFDVGKDLVTPDDACYGDLGCFSMSAPWFSLLRPLPAPNKPEEIETQFYLYTRGERDRFVVKQRSGVEFSVDGSHYDGRKETFFITHGFMSDGNVKWLSDMKNAILKKYDGNVFIVDWGKGASKLNYLQVAANTRVVGATLANLGKHLISREEADSSRFHIIGHSLGAQISSYAAKNITNVAKLTALDPAKSGFEGYDKTVRLDVSDADFVQVIHTSYRPFISLIGLGMIQAYGHVDFYMNGGWSQPGCILPPKPNITSFLDLATVPVEEMRNYVFCSHERSYKVLIAALDHDNCTFWGHRKSIVGQITDLQPTRPITSPDNDCDGDTCSPLGFEAINYPGRGSFNVVTSGMNPFCIAEPQVDSRMKQFRGMSPQVDTSLIGTAQ